MDGQRGSGQAADETVRLRQEAAELRGQVARLRQALAAEQRPEPPGTSRGTSPGPSPGPDRPAALAHGQVQLRAIMESAVDYAIVTADLDGRITSWSSGATRLLGWAAEEVLGRPCRLMFTPEDCQAGIPEAETRRALAEGSARDERWHVRRDGTRFWGVGELLPLRDGVLLGTLKILRDHTEQHRVEEQRRLLLNELSHRIKNTLAIVQSLVMQTVRGSEVPDALRETLEARLHALAATHDLLTRETWRGADLADLVTATLAPLDIAARVRAHGPALRLRPNTALVLDMALHELATNAVKYGALSRPGGAVEIAWRLAASAGEASGAVLDLLWSERGGPAVAQPTRRGFGSRLIEDSVSYQLGGRVDLRFDPAGVECRIAVPLPDVSEDA